MVGEVNNETANFGSCVSAGVSGTVYRHLVYKGMHAAAAAVVAVAAAVGLAVPVERVVCLVVLGAQAHI